MMGSLNFTQLVTVKTETRNHDHASWEKRVREDNTELIGEPVLKVRERISNLVFCDMVRRIIGVVHVVLPDSGSRSHQQYNISSEAIKRTDLIPNRLRVFPLHFPCEVAPGTNTILLQGRMCWPIWISHLLTGLSR